MTECHIPEEYNHELHHRETLRTRKPVPASLPDSCLSDAQYTHGVKCTSVMFTETMYMVLTLNQTCLSIAMV